MNDELIHCGRTAYWEDCSCGGADCFAAYCSKCRLELTPCDAPINNEKWCDDCGVILDIIQDDDCGGHNVAELLDAWVEGNPWRCCDCLTEYGRNCNTGAGVVSA